MRVTPFASFVVVVCIGVAGCGSSSSGSGAGGAAATGKTIRVHGKVVDNVSGQGLEAAEICVLKPDLGCVKTGADGTYTLDGVPVGVDAVATASAGDDYFKSVAIAHTTDTEMEANFAVGRRALGNILASSVGVTIDAQKGHVSFLASEDAVTSGPDAGKPLHGVPGATVKLVPDSGQLFYATESTTLDKKLTATTALGVALVFDATPTDAAKLAITPPSGMECTYPFATPGAPPNEITIPILADTITMVPVHCK